MSAATILDTDFAAVADPSAAMQKEDGGHIGPPSHRSLVAGASVYPTCLITEGPILLAKGRGM